MKKAALATAFALLAGSAMADEYVHGYTRSDGTYVQPHHRSSPDGNPYNNYSTQGNTNPYTGERGSANPEPSYQPYRQRQQRNDLGGFN